MLLYIFLWSLFSPKLQRSLNATMLHLVCPWALKQIHHLPASISMFNDCNLQLFVCTLPLIVFQGALTKAQSFLQALKSSLVLHSQRRGTCSDTGQGWVHSLWVVYNRIALSTNQLFKNVKKITEKCVLVSSDAVEGGAENKRRPCVSTVVTRLKWLWSCCHTTEVMSMCYNKNISCSLTLTNTIKMTSICGRGGHPWDLKKSVV